MQTYEISRYHCAECNLVIDELAVEVDPYEGDICPHCHVGGLRYLSSYTAPFVSVAAYSTDRAYGGPEEGGWWYTCGDILTETIRNFECCDFPQVGVYIETLAHRYGRDYEIRVTRGKMSPASFPTVRPVYC